MAYQNYTGNLTNASTFPDLVRINDTMVDGWFGSGILLFLWMTIYMVLGYYEHEKRVAVASFGTFIISVLFYVVDFVPVQAPTVLAVATVGSLFFLIRRN